MKNYQRIKRGLRVVSFFLIAVSCENESNKEAAIIETQNLTASVQQDFEIDDLLNDLILESDENTDETLVLKSASTEAEQDSSKIRKVTFDAKKRKVITVTYDEYKDANGNIKSGKIIITFIKGSWKEKGFIRKVKFVDFSLNGKLINGTKWITSLIKHAQKTEDGSETKPKRMQLIKHDLEIVLKDDTKLHKNGKRTRLWVKGGLTKDKMDDVYLIRGFEKADDISNEGLEEEDNTSKVDGSFYFKKIVKPLKKHYDYPFFTKGVKRVIKNSDTLWINYGDGAKDSLATVKINSGEIKEIVLE